MNPSTLYFSINSVRTRFGSPKDKKIKAQRAQHNEFVESGLETILQWVGQQS